MKIAAFVDISGGSGGGLQQTLGTINVLEKIKSDKYEIKFSSSSRFASNYFKSRGIESLFFNKSSFLNKLNLKLFKFEFVKKILKFFNISNSFEKFLNENNIDLVFFVDQSHLSIFCENKNFIFNVWNLDHKKLCFFPEYSYKKFINSEKIYKHASKRAFKIITDCKKTKLEFSEFYNCPKNKISILPLISNLIFNENNESYENENKSLKNIDLKKTLFFPAQFWAHKNHRYIVDAFHELNLKGETVFNCIFTGRDRGNLKFIQKKIREFGLEEKFYIYEYLEDEEIINIYKNCYLTILPTYVGNTSLPLFEAFYFKSRIAYNAEILEDVYKDKVINLKLDDPKNLYQIIKDISDNPKKFEIMTKNSKIFIDDLLDKSKITNRIKIIFDEYYGYHSRYK